jgi:hypothetical protein
MEKVILANEDEYRKMIDNFIDHVFECANKVSKKNDFTPIVVVSDLIAHIIINASLRKSVINFN